MSVNNPNSLLSKGQRNALIKWAKDYSQSRKMQVIWSEQAGPRPARPYGLLKFLTGPIKSGSDEERVCDDGSILISGDRTFTLSINIIGEDALDIISKIQNSLDMPSARDFFRANGLSASEDLGVQNLTALIESEYEGRAQMDVIFHFANNVKDVNPSGIIEKVELTGTHEGGKDTHIEECDIDSTIP